jgi:nucleotide-binding universal stress UspA family protein
MITTALIPLDGSPEATQAVPYAQAIVPTGGQMVLLNVIHESDLMLLDLLGVVQAGPEEVGYLDAARARLGQVVAESEDARLDWQTEVARGEPVTEILRAITRFGADVVVMTTHGRGAAGRAIFGSVADRIARTAPIPVLLIRPESPEALARRPAIRRLVVPLDGSPLAEEALPIVTELAQRRQIPVHLVRVVNTAALLAPLMGFGVPGLSQDVYAEVVESAGREARGYLGEVGCRLTSGGVATTWAVLEGTPFASIAEATNADDLVVMTSHGHGGVGRWLLGSVAEKLVREAPCPVLLVPAPSRGSASLTRSED